MATRKFMHRATLDYFRRGKLRIQCACGKISPTFEDEVFGDHVSPTGERVVTKEDQARAWYEKHTGLAELPPNRRAS